MIIKTGHDVKRARKQLGMSVNDLRDVLRLSIKTGNRTIRRWESGDLPITGPVCVAIEAMLKGFEPEYVEIDGDDYG